MDCEDRMGHMRCRARERWAVHGSPARPVAVTVALAAQVFLTACGGAAPLPAQTPATVSTARPPTATATTAAPSLTATATSPATTAAPTISPPTATAPPPTATATAIPPTAIPPVALYTADFANWPLGEATAAAPVRASFDPTTGEYRLAITTASDYADYYGYPPERPAFADFQLDVDVRRVAGPDNGGAYGLLFRTQPKGPDDQTNARYIFLVQPQEGYFALNLINATGPARNIAPNTTTPAINRGNASNHLTVICRGDTITLMINGQRVGTYSAPLTAAGTVGLLVENPRRPSGPAGMEAAFRNLRVSAAP